jgi:hypothetical protein
MCVSTLGYHLKAWQKALVIVIPKPNRDDLTAAKNFRPISLLETISKLIEKGMSKCLLFEIDRYHLIPTTQFGTQKHSSTTDAGLTLVHDIQAALRAKWHCGALLFDIKGFFDNVHKDRLAAIMANLGFLTGMVKWALSFLSERRVILSFNGEENVERDQLVGTPQGSLVLPVLLAIYTSPLLCKPMAADGCTLGMYVDDRIIFAQGRDWDTVTEALKAQYVICEEWLVQNNLAIEPEKTKLIFFRSPQARKDLPPDRLTTPATAMSPAYRVNPKPTIQYLGFFINHKLDWKPHVEIMCNQACASIKALQILGSMHCGLSMANWRLVFNAVCLPVLSYGCTLWFKHKHNLGLTKMVQQVINNRVKLIAGAFRTAPCEPLHKLTRVPLAYFYLDKLTTTCTLRLYRVPWTSQLLPHLGPDWVRPPLGGPHSPQGGAVIFRNPRVGPMALVRCPTTLEALGAWVPVEGPRSEVVAIPPWEVPNWRGRLTTIRVMFPNARAKWVEGLYRALHYGTIAVIRVDVAISNKDCYDNLMVGRAAAILTMHIGGSSWTWTQHWCLGTEVTHHDITMHGLAKAMEWLIGLYNTFPPPRCTYIISAASSAVSTITNIRALNNQQSVLLFHKSLTALCSQHQEARFTLAWAPKKRDRVQDSTVRFQALAACKQTPCALVTAQHTAAHQRAQACKQMFAAWAREWVQTCWKRGLQDTFTYEYAIPHPPDSKNHPMWRAATDKDLPPPPSRHTTSTVLHLMVGHTFTSTYARCFCKDIPEELNECDCSYQDRSLYHILYECTRHEWARNKCSHTFDWSCQPPSYFFMHRHGARSFLDFLTLSQAAFKPRTSPVVPFDPG